MIANSSVVFGRELTSELRGRGYSVDLLDFEHLFLERVEGVSRAYSQLFQPFKKIPKLHMLFRMFIILKVLKDSNYDVVNIHYNRWYYKLLMPYFKTSKTRLVISTYGSDFYRASSKIRRRLRSIYAVADAISFTNEFTKKEFISFYNDFEAKTHLCRFGLKTLEYIDRNRYKSRKELQKHLSYDSNKTVVSCGYNATSAQQHFAIIDAIEKLEKELRDRCQFIFLLTYGDAKYKERVKQRLESVEFSYRVLEEFLYEDDNAAVKLASDIMINVLQTDSFSGSMQEFLYAGNVVITGAWLPYGTFDDAGVFYLKIDSIDRLHDKLSYAIINREELAENSKKNKKIIANLSSWNENISSWIALLEGKK
jgi:glycosyltransferase involved in cell wall biosynthesis